MNRDMTEEFSTGMSNANEEEDNRRSDRGVDTVLNACEDSNEYGREPDDKLQG